MAARSHGQRLSLAAGSDLLRQQRARAPSFHRSLYLVVVVVVLAAKPAAYLWEEEVEK